MLISRLAVAGVQVYLLARHRTVDAGVVVTMLARRWAAVAGVPVALLVRHRTVNAGFIVTMLARR